MDTFNIFVGTAFLPVLITISVVIFILPFIELAAPLARRKIHYGKLSYLFIAVSSAAIIYIFHLIWAFPFYSQQKRTDHANQKYLPQIERIENSLLQSVATIDSVNAQRNYSNQWGPTISASIRSFVDGATLGFSRAESINTEIEKGGFKISLSGSKGIFIESERVEREMKEQAGLIAYHKAQFEFHKNKLEEILNEYYRALGNRSTAGTSFLQAKISSLLFLIASAILSTTAWANSLGLVTIKKLHEENKPNQ